MSVDVRCLQPRAGLLSRLLRPALVLEDHVKLAHGLRHVPGALQAFWYDEAFAGLERLGAAISVGDDHLAAQDEAELIDRITVDL